MRVIERIEGYYETHEAPFGVVYRWHPAQLLAKCGCGKRLTLTRFTAVCLGCGANHAAVVREELTEHRSEEQTLHPWHHAGEREEFGLPY